MTNWFVYIIKSDLDGTFYKGVTQDITKRLEEHNQGLSRYTSTKGLWTLVYLDEMSSKKEALIREKQLKRQNRKYLEWLILQPINSVNHS